MRILKRRAIRLPRVPLRERNSPGGLLKAHRVALPWFLLGALLLSSLPAHAQEGFRNIEYHIKAGYFAYLGGYVDWPDGAFEATGNEFVIGVLGRYPFGPSIRKSETGNEILVPLISNGDVQQVTGVDRLQGKRITIRRYATIPEFQASYGMCHILFVGRHADEGALDETVQDRLTAVLDRIGSDPVLIVVDAEDAEASKALAQRGAVISYWNDATHNLVRMFVNRSAEKDRRLSISAKFLRLSIVTPL